MDAETLDDLSCALGEIAGQLRGGDEPAENLADAFEAMSAHLYDASLRKIGLPNDSLNGELPHARQARSLSQSRR